MSTSCPPAMPEAEEVDSFYPNVDPTFFDLIVVGTGLPESILAAAAATAGKSVLHLDPNPFYGSLFSSLPLPSFSSLLLRPSTPPPTPPSASAAPLSRRSIFSAVEISSPETLEDPSLRSFSLDLSGPRLLFCSDPSVDLLLRSGASQHVEFKSVDATFVFRDGKLAPVPDSRDRIFSDRTLGLTEKTLLSRFFKLVRAHFAASADDNDDENRISDADLESPFVDFLQKQRLPPKIKAMILYAITMADYDQDDQSTCKKLIKTKDGMETLALYHSSIGRFHNAKGAFIYPIYGQGELPQAFCRCAAVKGALYILRMPATALLVDEERGSYKGLRLASAQDLYSRQLLLDPCLSVSQSDSSHLPNLQPVGLNIGEYAHASNPVAKVARGVCICRGSIQSDLSNLLIVFPPRSLFKEQVTSVRALQLGNNVAVCPTGFFVVYFSTLCDDTIQGKECLRAAMNYFFELPLSQNSKNATSVEGENVELEAKPILLWSALYVQELAEGQSDNYISSCVLPDGNIDYRNLIESTTELFHRMYPQQEMFPEAVETENTEDDATSN